MLLFSERFVRFEGLQHYTNDGPVGTTGGTVRTCVASLFCRETTNQSINSSSQGDKLI